MRQSLRQGSWAFLPQAFELRPEEEALSSVALKIVASEPGPRVTTGTFKQLSADVVSVALGGLVFWSGRLDENLVR